MKYIKLITIAITICFTFSSCSLYQNETATYFGFSTSDFVVLEEEDTHGGFLGDGSYYLILDCSQNTSKAYELIKDWEKLPLYDNLNLAMYGGKKDGIIYGYNFAEEAHLPTVTNGVYKFVDRHANTINSSDDTNLLSRYSFNFSLAVYDFNTDTLYYFEMDT